MNFGKVMFPVVCVCLLTECFSCDHYPLCHWSVIGHVECPRLLSLHNDSPPPFPFKFVHCAVQTVNKQAVGIWLKCVVVFTFTKASQQNALILSAQIPNSYFHTMNSSILYFVQKFCHIDLYVSEWALMLRNKPLSGLFTPSDSNSQAHVCHLQNNLSIWTITIESHKLGISCLHIVTSLEYIWVKFRHQYHCGQKS